MTTFATQGDPGALSEEAARKLLGESIEVVACETFDIVFDSVTSGEASCALVPIENSLAGSVLRNYELLAAGDFVIGGEVFLRISLNLIGLKGVRFEEVRRVYSHPVALAQCHRFIAEHKLDAQPAYDTAGSVKQLVRHGAREEAAIAGTAAAEIYGAEILARGIEDHRENFTRFLLIAPPAVAPHVPATKGVKTTILFRTPNKQGATF